MAAHRSIRRLAALTTSLFLAAGLLAMPAGAAGGGVKGVVTLDGRPLAGATVSLMRADDDSGDAYEVAARATTSATGSYSFTGYPRSGFIYDAVIVTDPQHRAVTTERSFRDSTTRVVTRNVTMAAAGSITGTITRADGSASSLTRVQVEGPDTRFGGPGNEELVYDDDRGVAADGTYRFVGLPAGEYTIQHDDPAGTYLSECTDGRLARPGSNPYCAPDVAEVTVRGGEVTTATPQVLDHAGARVLGTVTNTSGTALKGIRVEPFALGSSETLFPYEFSTRSSGRYTLTPLPASRQQLRFSDPGGVWETRWIDSPNRTGSRELVLEEGVAVKGVDVRVRSRSILTASATGGTGRATVTIGVTRKVTGSRPSGTVTVSSGSLSRTAAVVSGRATVTLTGLAAGRQDVRVAYSGTTSTADVAKDVAVTVR